jgi:hypothetical protein
VSETLARLRADIAAHACASKTALPGTTSGATYCAVMESTGRPFAYSVMGDTEPTIGDLGPTGATEFSGFRLWD